MAKTRKIAEVWRTLKGSTNSTSQNRFGVRIAMKFPDDYKKLEKNAIECDQENQDTFKSTLIQLFDVATSDTLSVMKIEEVKQQERKSAREGQFRNFATKVALALWLTKHQ